MVFQMKKWLRHFFIWYNLQALAKAAKSPKEKECEALLFF